jgi:hypothetical protein
MYMTTEQMRNIHIVLTALIQRAEADGADYTPELLDHAGVVLPSMPVENARAALLNVESQMAIDGEELAA